jgi:large subunit ribosomal protein L1
MARYGKKHQNALQIIDRQKKYPLENGLTLAIENAYASFDESLDISVVLGVNPKYPEQMVRGGVSLPHGLGKETRVIAFCKGEKEEEALNAGADAAGSEELIQSIQQGWLEFDKAVATPDMMSQVGKIGKILGPRGMMPNAKSGTVTFEIGNAIRELKAGKVEYRVDKAGVVHAAFGKVSFGSDKLIENVKCLLEALNKAKPSTAKGTYFRSISLSTTMGPGIKIETSSLRDYLE